jgi:hypothetical protein
MNLSPLSWSLTAKITVLIIVAAGTGAGAALVVNAGGGSGAAATPYSSCATRIRETQHGSSPPGTQGTCAGLAGATGVSRPSAGASPVGSSAVASPAPDPSAANPDSGDCLLGANGVDVQVGIADPTVSCASWIQNLAGTGLVWYPISQMVAPGSAGTADSETMEEACDLTDGTEELYVEDAGGQSYGDSICSQEEQNGWTPESSPGPLASQAQQQAEQQAQAQASASAAASQASANAAAEQQAQNDLSTLQGWSLSNDLSSLSSDVTQTNNDLATVKSDAANGQGSYCDNVYTAADDADTVSYDADTLSDDLDTLTNDIATGRSDIGAFQGDLSTLQQMGLPAPSGAQAAISAAQGTLSQAVQTANTDIGQENGLVSQAYSIANDLATGSCSGGGPGSPPSPIQDIS